MINKPFICFIFDENYNDVFYLPVAPQSFTITQENAHQTVNVQTVGEVSILGKRGLKNIELSSFFPAQDYGFMYAEGYKTQDPYYYVRKFLKYAQVPIRVIIEGAFNKLVIQKSFSYWEDDATKDVKYSLSLQEYRPPSYKKGAKVKTEEDLKAELVEKRLKNLQSSSLGLSKKNYAQLYTAAVNNTYRMYRVKKGDTLKSISKKYYGTTTYVSKLYSINKLAIEKAAKENGKTSSSKNGVKGAYLFAGTVLVVPRT